MKLKELFEDVIDLQAARKKREDALPKDYRTDPRFRKASHELDDTETKNTIAMDELTSYEQWMNMLKQKARLPGFKDINDVMSYLVADTEFPHKITPESAKKWFGSLDEQEKAKIRMIANHAPRLMKVYGELKARLHNIMDEWKVKYAGLKEFDALDAAAYLDSEFAQDLFCLREIIKAISYVGY